MNAVQTSMMHTGIKTTRSKAPKARFLRWIEFLLGLILVVGLPGAFGAYMTNAPQFKVRRVLFEGVHFLDEKEILKVANITEDDSILFLNTEEITQRVEKIPYVKRCEVRRRYPDEILLRIVERKPVAAIFLKNRTYEIDRELVVLRELSPFAIHTGPLITNLPGIEVVEPGTQLPLPELRAALYLWRVFQSLPFADKLTLSEISAESVSDLRMFFEELPYEMRWGRSDIETQARRLAILWDERKGNIPCESYLDLRFDEDLVCR